MKAAASTTTFAAALAAKQAVIAKGGTPAEAQRAMAETLMASMGLPTRQVPGECRVNCRACDDTGFVHVQDGDGRKRVTRCLCAVGQKGSPVIASVDAVLPQEALERLYPRGLPAPLDTLTPKLKAAGIPAAGLRWTFTSYVEHFAALPMANRYAQYGPLWARKANIDRPDLVLFGSHGLGKTGFTVCLARHLLQAGDAVRWWATPELFIAWQATFNDGTTDAFFRTLLTYDVLILDELMGQKATEFVEQVLTTVISARQRDRKPTVVTLNTIDAPLERQQAQLASLLGPALMDRFGERAELWPFQGPSQRKAYRRS